MFAAFTTVDSLVANEFTLELAGKPVAGIFKIAGFVSFARDENGKRIKPTFEISKMVQRDPKNPFNQWIQDTTASRNGGDAPRRDLALLAVDDGVITRRWTVKGAFITRISYSDFDTASSDMVSETVTLGYNDIEEVFTV